MCTYILKGVFKRENLKDNAHDALFVYGIIGIFVGARLGHCLFYDTDRIKYSKCFSIKINQIGEIKFIGYSGLA